MRIFRQIAAFAVLNLFSCAEDAQAEIPPTLNAVSSELMRVICSYLDDPFPFSTLGNLNGRFKKLFSTELSAKSIFKEHFDIPELVTDDIGDDEPELKFIIASFSKFKNPDHLYGALRNKFLFGTNFNVLIPNLLKYFDRHDPKRFKMLEKKVLMARKKFELFFQGGSEGMNFIFNRVLNNYNNYLNFQEYVLLNPENYERFLAYKFESWFFVADWVKIALASNMPDKIFNAFPRYHERIFDATHIWTGFYIPRSNYPQVFERINFIIDNLEFDNTTFSSNESDNDSDSSNASSSSTSSPRSAAENVPINRLDRMLNFKSKNIRFKRLYNLLNLIRFGPEDLHIFEEKIQNKNFEEKEIALMCHCASLANKMDLFFKLLPETVRFLRTNVYYLRLDCWIFNNDANVGPIEMHKFIFDLHQFTDPDFRQLIYNSSDFVRNLSNYYDIIYIKWTDLTIEIVFKISPELIDSGFPETFTMNHSFTSKDLLRDYIKYFNEKVSFGNDIIYQIFLEDYFNEFGDISDHRPGLSVKNLKLIMKSDSICQWLQQRIALYLIPCQPFEISPYELLQILDEPIDHMTNIIKIAIKYIYQSLHLYETHDQFEKFEKIFGFRISILLGLDLDYFEYRQLYKYVIEKGQPLPSDLSEKTRTLLKIDFPTLNLDL